MAKDKVSFFRLFLKYTLGGFLSLTVGNLFYSARIVNFFNFRLNISKTFIFFGKDIRSAKRTWDEELHASCYRTFIGQPEIETYIFSANKESLDSSGINLPEINHNTYYRIHCPGSSGQCARHFEELQDIATATNTVQITFSPPGVGESKGFVLDKDDLIEAVFQQAKHLIDAGADPKKITVSGMSLGAAVTVCCYERINQYILDQNVSLGKTEDPSVFIYADRTFGDFTKEISDQILFLPFKALKNISRLLFSWIPFVGTPLSKYFLEPIITIVEKLFYYIAYIPVFLFIKSILVLSNWDLQPQKKWDNILPEKKASVYVKPRTEGENGSKLKSIAKAFGIFHSHPDDKIRAAQALQTAPKQRADFKGLLLEIKHLCLDTTVLVENPDKKLKLIDNIRECLDNKTSINIMVHRQLEILLKALESKEPQKEELKNIIKKILELFKSERLVVIGPALNKDAHEATYKNIVSRKSHSVETWEAELIGQEEDKNLKSHYMLFDKALKGSSVQPKFFMEPVKQENLKNKH